MARCSAPYSMRSVMDLVAGSTGVPLPLHRPSGASPMRALRAQDHLGSHSSYHSQNHLCRLLGAGREGSREAHGLRERSEAWDRCLTPRTAVDVPETHAYGALQQPSHGPRSLAMLCWRRKAVRSPRPIPRILLPGTASRATRPGLQGQALHAHQLRHAPWHSAASIDSCHCSAWPVFHVGPCLADPPVVANGEPSGATRARFT